MATAYGHPGACTQAGALANTTDTRRALQTRTATTRGLGTGTTPTYGTTTTIGHASPTCTTTTITTTTTSTAWSRGPHLTNQPQRRPTSPQHCHKENKKKKKTTKTADEPTTLPQRALPKARHATRLTRPVHYALRRLYSTIPRLPLPHLAFPPPTPLRALLLPQGSHWVPTGSHLPQPTPTLAGPRPLSRASAWRRDSRSPELPQPLGVARSELPSAS